MAKKTKPSKSKSSGSSGGGDSNTGLIVTLVIFVLMSITLGVFTYFGYDGQKQYQETAAKANRDAAAAKKALDEELARRLVLAIATGNEVPGDQQKLQAAKGTAQAAYSAALGSLKDISWDAGQERPKETYQDLIARLKKETASAQADKKTAESNLNESKAAFDAMTKSLNQKLDESNAGLKKAQSDIVETQRKEREDYTKKIKEIDTQSVDLTKEKQSRADDAAAAEREKRKFVERVDNLNKQIDVIKGQLTPPNSLEADTPKGRIIRVDREAGLAYINLGSADFAKPNLTFSVMPPSITGKIAASKDRKGALEIATVLEQHLSVARITEQASPLRDPILAGDLIFNPSWNSSQREHVALAGIFDLDGDGRDDTLEVVRALERQGIVVDAYLDLRDRTIKGPGITERTTYLIAGDRPELSESMARSGRPEENQIVQGVKQVNEKIGELESVAKEKGVQKVNFRRYLALIGYPLPKVTRQVDTTSATYLGKPAAAPSSEEKPK